MRHTTTRQALLIASTSLLITACGGGASSGSSAAPAAAPVSQLNTYASSSAASSTSSAPASATLKQFIDAANSLTLERLYASYHSDSSDPFSSLGNDSAAISSLSLGPLHILAAAATGTSAAEFTPLDTRFGPRDQWAKLLRAAHQDAPHQRSLLATTGKAFANAFLDATRDIPHWSASEAPSSSFDNPQTHLLINDSLTLNTPLADASPLSGSYQHGSARYQMPLLRITTGVSRHTGSDYIADRLPLADGKHILITARPTSGHTLIDLSAARLQAIVLEASTALLGTAPLPAGQILLPARSYTLNTAQSATFSALGIHQLFDQTQANLRPLDLIGGHYAELKDSAASLNLSASTLDFTSNTRYAFTYNPLNLYAPGSGGSAGVIISTGPSYTCYPDTAPADLGPQLLLIVNKTTGFILSAMVLTSPAGTLLGHYPCPG